MENLTSLSKLALIEKYVPSADPTFASKLLNSSEEGQDVYSILRENTKPVTVTVDAYGIDHRKEISELLINLQTISQATKAPDRAMRIQKGELSTTYDHDYVTPRLSISDYYDNVSGDVIAAGK